MCFEWIIVSPVACLLSSFLYGILYDFFDFHKPEYPKKITDLSQKTKKNMSNSQFYLVPINFKCWNKLLWSRAQLTWKIDNSLSRNAIGRSGYWRQYIYIYIQNKMKIQEQNFSYHKFQHEKLEWVQAWITIAIYLFAKNVEIEQTH
jgi:hypothetical protein